MKRSSRPLRPCAALVLCGLLASCGAGEESDPPTATSEAETAWPPIPSVFLDTVYDHVSSWEVAEQWERLPIQRIELDSSGCYGACPQYTLSFSRGGAARFYGRDFVEDMEGHFAGQIYLTTFARLCLFVERFRFRDMEPRYSAPWTDDNTLTITVIDAETGKVTTVQDYGEQGPPELLALVLALEDAMYDIDWERAVPEGR